MKARSEEGFMEGKRDGRIHWLLGNLDGVVDGEGQRWLLRERLDVTGVDLPLGVADVENGSVAMEGEAVFMGGKAIDVASAASARRIEHVRLETNDRTRKGSA
jgi:hypothetical protein